MIILYWILMVIVLFMLIIGVKKTFGRKATSSTTKEGRLSVALIIGGVILLLVSLVLITQ